MALDIKKFIHRFIDEAREQLRLLEEGLEQLATDPDNNELVNSLFRAAHTIKGSSRMLKLLPISETAHSLEDVLGALRENRIRLDSHSRDLMLEAVDSLGHMVEQLSDQPDPASLPDKPAALCQRRNSTRQSRPCCSAGDQHHRRNTPGRTRFAQRRLGALEAGQPRAADQPDV